jgi:hypothetical protein
MLFSLCYWLGVRAVGRVNDGILRPAAESSMSAVRRPCLVSSLFPLITHQIAALRYQAA